MSVDYQILEGGAKLEDILASMAERASDFAPAFAEVVESFHEIEERRFESNGPGWLPLSEATMTMGGSWARGNQNFDQILNDSGALMSSMGGGVGSYIEMTPFSVEMGTTLPYAHWHQTGGTRLHASGAGWPPERQIVEITPADVAEWTAIIRRYIFESELASA